MVPLAAVNTSALDRWSWVHALNGLGVGLSGIGPTWAFVGAGAYEVVEYYHERDGSKLFGTKAPESLLNVAADTALYALAYYGGRELRESPGAGIGAFGAFTAAALTTWLITPFRR